MPENHDRDDPNDAVMPMLRAIASRAITCEDKTTLLYAEHAITRLREEREAAARRNLRMLFFVSLGLVAAIYNALFL